MKKLPALEATEQRRRRGAHPQCFSCRRGSHPAVRSSRAELLEMYVKEVALSLFDFKCSRLVNFGESL